MRTLDRTIKRRISTTVEVERVLIVRQPSAELVGWCERCGARVSVTIPEPAQDDCVHSQDPGSEGTGSLTKLIANRGVVEGSSNDS